MKGSKKKENKWNEEKEEEVRFLGKGREKKNFYSFRYTQKKSLVNERKRNE